MNRGFTLIELLVTVTIIVLLSTIFLINYRVGEKHFALQRSAHILAQDIRRMQELAVRAEDFQGTVSRGGFGINLVNATSSYILFADCNWNMVFDATGAAANCAAAGLPGAPPFPEKLERRELERGVTITSLSPSPTSSIIVFIPPDPGIRVISGGVATTTVTVTLGINDLTARVIVNNAGLITVE